MKFEKTLLLAGSLIAGLITIFVFFGNKEISILLISCAFALPALILAHYAKAALPRSYVLVIITWVVPISAMLIVLSIASEDQQSAGSDIVMCVIASIVCSVIFFLTVAKTYKKPISISDTIVWPIVIGSLSVVIPVTLQLIYEKQSTESLFSLLGLFSIFPVWFYLTGRHLMKMGVVSS